MQWRAALLLFAALPAMAQEGRYGDYPVIAPPGFHTDEYNSPSSNDYYRSWSNRPAQPQYRQPDPYDDLVPRMEPQRPPQRPMPRTSGPLVPPRPLSVEPIRPTLPSSPSARDTSLPARGGEASPSSRGEVDATAPPAIRPAVIPPRTRMPQGPTLIPPHIVFMRTAGLWKSNGQQGFVRVIIGRTSPRDESMRLYVQWIVTDKQADRFALADSIELPEMYDWRIRLDDYEIAPAMEDAEMTLEGTALLTGVKRKYRLKMGAPGIATLTAQ